MLSPPRLTANVSPEKEVKNDDARATEILQLAGRALFLCQFVELNLASVCRMFPETKNLNPQASSECFGRSKERTPSVQALKKALQNIGIDPDYYLFDEISEFFARRDWLAHRMFLEMERTRDETRRFQKSSLNEMIERGTRLCSVLLAVQKQIAENLNVAPQLPDGHIVTSLTSGMEKEVQDILAKMKSVS